MIRFECDFRNPKTGEGRTVTVDLDDGEVVAAGRHACPDICAQAMALRKVYAELPRGFRHTAPPRRVFLQ